MGPAPGNAVLDLRIGLKQSKWEELERHLYEVSDPFHARYGQHLSADEVNKLIAPQESTLANVHAWLQESGCDSSPLSYSPAKDWIKLSIPVSDVESLLQTKYFIYRHEDGTELIRTSQWSLPSHLLEHISTIQPTTSFLRMSPMRKFSRLSVAGVTGDQIPDYADAEKFFASPNMAGTLQVFEKPLKGACNVSAVTSTCLRTLYNTIDYTPKAASKNSIAFCNYLNETALTSDVELFIERYAPTAAGSSINYTIIANGPNDQGNLTTDAQASSQDIEGNLDAETIIGITHPTIMKAYNTGGSPPYNADAATVNNTNEPYLDWVNYMLSLPDDEIPQTISTSYGDDEQSVPQSYATAVCQQLAQLGARGVSLLYASGDVGVGRNGTCVSNDGKNTTMFIPNFPVSCPYVTAVGATKNFSPEVVAYNAENGFSPGGGFSNYFAQPAYQASVVNSYVKSLGSKYQGLYNASGRAYPDVAAQGQQFLIVWAGKNIQVDGTSASTPTFASVVALVNDALVADGKAPLGFLNPWLYSVGYHGLTDVTEGSTMGCESDGFPAMKGWDAASGFGTPVSYLTSMVEEDEASG